MKSDSFLPISETITSWKGNSMLRSNDFFAVIRRSGYFAPFLVFLPLSFRLLILTSLFLLLLFERSTSHSRKATSSQVGLIGIVQQEELWRKFLPLWVSCLLLTNSRCINGEMIPLRYPVYLSATRQGYELIQCSREPAKWQERWLEGFILLLLLLPVLSVFLPLTLLAIGVGSGAILCQVYLQAQAFRRYLRMEESELLEVSETQGFPTVKVFRSYLPQENAPAFAWRSWHGQEIYLDARLLQIAPASVTRTLLTHEQGHVMLGHTTLLFLLRCCRYMTVVTGLLALSVFNSTLMHMSGPAAIPWLLAFLGGLLAPDIVKFICKSAWEQKADEWAAIRLGQGAIYTARLYIASCYQGK